MAKWPTRRKRTNRLTKRLLENFDQRNHLLPIYRQTFNILKTAKDQQYYNEQFYRFKWLAVECYLKNSNHSESLKEDVVASFKSLFQNTSKLNDRPEWSKLLEEFKSHEQSMGQDRDPLILYGLAVAQLANSEQADALKNLNEAIHLFRSTTYPSRTVVQAFNLKYEINSDRAVLTPQGIVGPEKPVDYWEAIVYWFDMDYRADAYEQRFVWAIMSDAIDTMRLRKEWIEEFRDQLAKNKVVPDWLQNMINGKLENRMAWGFRGDGYANTVGRSQWELFNKHQTKAAGFWKKAYQICPTFPEPAAELMDVARNENTNETEVEWFEKAIAAQYDYPPAYRQRQFGLLPRWGGSHQEVMEFGKSCLEEGRFETRVPYQYIEAIIQVVKDGGKRLIDNDPTVYQTANQCLENLYKHHANSESDSQRQWARRIRSYQATLNSMFGHHEIAAPIYKDLGDDFVAGFERMLQFHGTADELRRQSIKATVKYSPEVRQLVDLFKLPIDQRNSKRSEIDKLLISLSDSTLDPNEKLVVQQYFQLNAIEKKYQANEKVTLTFDPEFLLWDATELDQFEFIDENTIKVSNEHASTFTVLRHIGEFDGPKTVEFEVEPIQIYDESNTARPSVPIYFGMLFGEIKTLGATQPTADSSVLASTVKQRIGMAQWANTIVDVSCSWPGEKKKFRIDIDNTYVEVRVDNEFVLANDLRTAKLDPKLAIVIQPQFRPARGAFQIQNITIKKLDLELYKKRFSLDEEVAFIESRLKIEPRNAAMWEMLAQATLANDQFDRCLEACNKSVELGRGYQKIGFFLGHIADTKGERKKAMDYYKKAIDSPQITVLNILKSRNPVSIDVTDMAKARYLWLSAAHPDFKLEFKEDFQKLKRKYRAKYQVHWESLIHQALDLSYKGKFEAAAKQCEAALRSSPSELEETIQKMLDAFKEFQLYEMNKDDEPYYLNDDLTKRLWTPNHIEKLYGFR